MKNSNKFWLVLNILAALGLLGIFIYRLVKGEFDWVSLLVILVLISNIFQLIKNK